MKLNQLLGCSAPLLAERPKEIDYPYWFGGTCFRVRHQGCVYIVTAAHCLKDKSKDEVRVQRRPDSAYFTTLVALFTQAVDARHEEDPHQDDWAVFQANEPPQGDPERLGDSLDLDTIPLANPSGQEPCKFVVRGYPKAICAINYERNAIRWQAFAGTGVYMGRPSWGSHCHTMKLDDVSGIESIDGLSGSPVFMLASELSGFRAFFAGMVLMGSQASGLLHFLDAKVISAAVAKAHIDRRS